MFPTFLLFVGILGYQELQLSSREQTLKLTETATIRTVVDTSQAAVEEYLVSLWVKFDFLPTDASPFIAYIQKNRALAENALFRISKEMKGNFLIDIEQSDGSYFRTEFPGIDTGEWEQIILQVKTSTGEVTFCTSQWRGSPHCLSHFSSQAFAVLHTGSSSSAHLAKSARTSVSIEENPSAELLHARLILGATTQLEVQEIMTNHECAKFCLNGCWGPGASSCRDYVRLLKANDPRDLETGISTWKLWDQEFSGHHLQVTGQFALTGWFSLGENTETRVIAVQTRECEFCDSTSETCPEGCEAVSLYHQKTLKACLEVSNQNYICLESNYVDGKKWHFLSISYCAITQMLELCTAAWEGTATCFSRDVSTFHIEKRAFELVTLYQVEEGQAVDLRYYSHTCLTSAGVEAMTEDKRKDCKSGCRFLNSLDEHLPRRLQPTTHYSFTVENLSYSGGTTVYQTFENTHVSTTAILFSVTDTSGTNAVYSVFLYKPWGGSTSWACGSGSAIQYILSSTDPVIIGLGSMTGSYTIEVDGPTAGAYTLMIEIQCSSTISACYCSAGYYPNPSVSSCAACSVNDVVCPYAVSLGCIEIQYSSTYSPSDAFNCNLYSQSYFSSATGLNGSCDPTCISCVGPASNQCASCFSNAELSIANKPSICICSVGYFTTTTSASCVACDPSCASCSSAATTCLTCYSNAALASGICKCLVGWYPNPDAGSCSACDSTCASCTTGGTTGCSSCNTHATLAGGTCVCSSGYTFDSTLASCVVCHPTCLTCNGTTASNCLTCQLNAGVSGGVCVCNSGYYPNTTSANCVSCNSTCATCSGGGSAQCITCKSNATAASGICSCNAGFSPNPTSATCASCNPTCATCNGTTASNCLTCKTNASLASGVCSCNGGYYPNTTSANCAACDPTCQTCIGGGPTNCATCVNINATVSSGTCSCNAGYYPNPTSANCAACDPTCQTCIGGGPTNCATCVNINASVSSGTCTCDAGFYPNTTAANCSSCDPTCATCTGGNTNNCLTCQASASMSSGVCSCNNGYFPNLTSATCASCSLVCLTCTTGGSSSCTSCQSNAHLFSTSPSSCMCSDGFYPNTDPSNCSPCHSTCATCAGGTPAQCSSCKNFAILSAQAPSSCICEGNAYPSPDASSCKLCSPTCGSCVASGSSSCSTCLTGAFLTGPPPNACQCNPGSYPAPDASQCSPCDGMCASCSNSIECLSCKGNAQLSGAKCGCPGGFYGAPDASNCVACTEGCITCLLTGCITCISGLFLLNQQCVSTCPTGYQPTSNFTCDPGDLNPPIPTLTALSNNSLSVGFNHPMNCTLLSTDVFVDIHDSNDVMDEVTWKDPYFVDVRTLMIEVGFGSKNLPSGCVANLTFFDKEKVKDVYNVSVNVTFLTTPLVSSETNSSSASNSSSSTTQFLQTTTGQQTASAVKGGTAAGVAASLLNGSPAGIITLINQLQLVSYLCMTKIQLPQEFGSTLAALNVGFMLPNPFKGDLPNINISKNDTSQVPQQFLQNYGIQTLLFIPNSFSFLGYSCVILLMYLPIFMLSRVKVRFIASYFKKKLPSLKWSTPLNLWLTSYLDLGVFSLLQLLNARNSTSSVYAGGSLALACICVTCFTMTPLLLISFTYRNFNLIHSRVDRRFNQRWGALFLNFRNDGNCTSVAYYSLFTIRRLALAFTLTLGQDSLGTIALLNSSFGLVVRCMQFFLYVVVYKPYESRLDQVGAVIGEGSTCLIFFTASSFLLDLSAELQQILNQTGVWLVRAAVGLNLMMSVIGTVVTVAELLKAYRERMEEIKSKYTIRDMASTANNEEVSLPSEPDS